MSEVSTRSRELQIDRFTAACYEYRGATRSAEVKKASEYFLSLRSRPVEALQLAAAVLQEVKGEALDVYLLASQLLVAAASKADSSVAVIESLCQLSSSSEYEWKSSPSVCSQISLAVAYGVVAALKRLRDSNEEIEATETILVSLQQGVRDRVLYVEILGLLPEALMKHRVAATSELHGMIAGILETEFQAMVEGLTISEEETERSLFFLCQIVQSLSQWLDLVIEASGESSANASTLYSKWVGTTAVNWSFDVLRNPKWLNAVMVSDEGDGQGQGQREYYYKALELFSTVCQSVEILPRQNSAAYTEQCLSLVSQVLSHLSASTSSSEGRLTLSGNDCDSPLTSLLIMLCGCSSQLICAALKHHSSLPVDFAVLASIFTYFDGHLKGYLRFLAEAPPSPSALDLLVCVAEDLCGSVSEAMAAQTQTHSHLPPELTKSAEEGVLQVVGLCISYSALHQATCTVVIDDTSEIGPRYNQGEGGEFRKRLRDALRCIARAWTRVPVAVTANYTAALSAFLAGSELWPIAEMSMHAVSAIVKDLPPVTMLEVATLAAHPRVLACRPLARFAVVIIGECVPTIVSAELPEAEGHSRVRAINAAFVAVTSSLLHAEEAPARLSPASSSLVEGGLLAFRLNEDHIGVVSLGKLLGCLPVLAPNPEEGEEGAKRRMAWALEAVVGSGSDGAGPVALPEEQADPDTILAMVVRAYWALLRGCLSTTPCFVGTTFKSFLVATRALVGSLSRGLREGFVLAPFLAALLRTDQGATVAMAACFHTDTHCLTRVAASLQKLTRLQLSALLTACSEACAKAWGRGVDIASVEYRSQMVAGCFLPALPHLIAPTPAATPTAQDSPTLHSSCHYLLRTAELLQVEAPERALALPLLREAVRLGLSLYDSSGGAARSRDAPVDTYSLLLSMWRDYASFLCDIGPAQEDALLLARVVPAACGFLPVYEAEGTATVVTSPSMNKALFTLLLALLTLQAKVGSSTSLLGEGCLHCITRTLLVACVVKPCSAERETALQALLALFGLLGGAKTVSLLSRALHVEPRVIAVTNKAPLKAFDSLALAAEKGDWKKFKSASRQLTK